MPVSPQVVTVGALPFTHSKLSVDQTLKTFERYLGWLARLDWHAQSDRAHYAPDWRRRNNLAQDREPEDTPEDRADWFRFILGTAMAYGMDLPTTSHPDPVELVWAVARWAHGALLHIQGLEQAHQRAISEWAASDLRQQQEYETLLKALEEQQKRTSTLDALLASAHAVIDQHTQEGDRLRESLDRAEMGRAAMEQRHAHVVADLRAQLEHAQALTRSAESARDAWESSAKSSQDALALLKAALRIPASPVTSPAEVVDLLDPADVAKTALVRR